MPLHHPRHQRLMGHVDTIGILTVLQGFQEGSQHDFTPVESAERPFQAPLGNEKRLGGGHPFDPPVKHG